MDELKELTDVYQRLFNRVKSGKLTLPKKRNRKSAVSSEEVRSKVWIYLNSEDAFEMQDEMRGYLFRYIARKPELEDIDVDRLIKRFAGIELEDFGFVRTGKVTVYDIIHFYRGIDKQLLTKSLVKVYRESFVGQKTKQDIEKLLPLNPIDAYPDARCLKRHFILHVGATNTGKTYQSLQRLKEASHGIYLSPLRLLALEVQERFLMDDVMCSMTTGEEEDIVPGATIMSCTVEKLHIEEVFDIAVIDECQMINDRDRGYAWTRAILGIMCPEIHLCMAPEAEEIIVKMIEECQDTYEIHRHTRDTELVFQPGMFNVDRDLKKGDALIVFSKKKVLALASYLQETGVKVSVIYGALPYQSRKEQVRMFVNGETDVVVATDAIGMGMNLPIQRIVIMEASKFDGVDFRDLEGPEVKQIGGRAGRKGMYDIGYVAAAEEPERIEALLESVTPPIPVIHLGVPDEIIRIDQRLDDILLTWKSLPVSGIYERSDISREVNLYRMLYDRLPELKNEDYYACITIPFAEIPEVTKQWLIYCVSYFTQGEDSLWFPARNPKNLDDYETYYKILDLYYQFCTRFNLPFEQELLSETKSEVAKEICNILVDNLKKYGKKCKRCGKALSWNHPYNLCEECHALPPQLRKLGGMHMNDWRNASKRQNGHVQAGGYDKTFHKKNSSGKSRSYNKPRNKT
ncbi:MAG: helicase [Lachnospiraceae bacterium]|nr:helicase [Lachnospiraceae bacterium]